MIYVGVCIRVWQEKVPYNLFTPRVLSLVILQLAVRP